MEDTQVADDLGSLLGDLEAAAKLPTKRRQTSIKPTVEATTTALYDRGALPEQLSHIVDLLTVHNHLDQASLGALVRNLYPSAKVADDVVLRFVGALGHGQFKPSFPLQALFLRWLVMVYHLLENPAVLSQAYAVLFNLLDTAAIRPQLCHLLALVTRRKHVRPYRIQAILTLSRQTGGDPHLTGLLRVFKNYYPEIIVGEATRGRASTFKHPDPQWRERLDVIQHRRLDQDTRGTRNGFAVHHALGRQMKGARSLFPAVHTQQAQESSVTLEEIDNAAKFVENLERIELPTQLVAVLADPLLQKLLLLRPDSEGAARVSNWLMGCLGDISDGDVGLDFLLDMMEVIHEYTISTRRLSPVLVAFIREFLKVWDGKSKLQIVLETLSLTPLQKSEDIFPLFEQFEQAMLDGTATSQISLLRFYTLLLRNWTITLQSDASVPSLPTSALSDLIVHVNKLTLTLTQTAPAISVYLVILDFYDTCSSVFSHSGLLRHVEITIPPALVVYLLHFNQSLVVTSRLCRILATYKQAWEGVMVSSSPSSRQLTRRETEQISIFNGFLMDLCNCLWRGRAFATTDLNAQGCRVPPAIQPTLESYIRNVDDDLALSTIFGLSYSPVLCLQAISFVRELEDFERDLRIRHAGPVTQTSLSRLADRGGLGLTWQEYKSGVLSHLESQGFPGIPELMYNTMKNLMKKKQG